MAITTRAIEKDELKHFLTVTGWAFGSELDKEEFEAFKKKSDHDRFVVAVDEADEVVGTAGAHSFEVTVPGGTVLPAAGVTVVGVLPTHRRRGALGSMMRFQLDDVRRRGEPLAMLWASESSIYGRYGYGMASTATTMNIERTSAVFRHDPGPSGSTRLLSEEAALLVLPEVYDRVRAVTPGMVRRSQAWWEAHSLLDIERRREGYGPLFRAVWELDGEAQAFALYRIKDEWSEEGLAGGSLSVQEAHGTSIEAVREIWRFLFGVDLIKNITSWVRPLDDPLWHLLVDPRRMRKTLHDGLWLRVIDLRAALEARTYGRDGALTFELHDPLCQWNEGVHRLEVSDGKGRVVESDDLPELTLDAEELGATYLGGVAFTSLKHGGRITEHADGAALRATQMFLGERYPFCPELF